MDADVRLYENLIAEGDEVLNEDYSNLNPNSLIEMKNCKLEAAFGEAKAGDRFQFLRHGFFSVDTKDSGKDRLVFNRIVSLKSSYKPNKN